MIQFKNGRIVKDDLINIEKPFYVEEDFLNEDLFLLFDEKRSIALDVGWYDKEFGSCFTISIIKDEDWDKPLYIKDIKNVSNFEIEFYYALGLFDGMFMLSAHSI